MVSGGAPAAKVPRSGAPTELAGRGVPNGVVQERLEIGFGGYVLTFVVRVPERCLDDLRRRARRPFAEVASGLFAKR
jgi:hypothetical protein